MSSHAALRDAGGRIALWVLTIVPALGIGIAGAAKLFGHRWDALFLGWGYPRWFLIVVGVAELAGAVCLLVPKLAAYAAIFLTVVMLGAMMTLLSHPVGPLGWGATPLVYAVLLLTLARMRWMTAWSLPTRRTS
jgi:putative oxidoreductase